jgi:hypothetical protein
MNTLIDTLFNDIHRITPTKNSRIKESGDVYTSEIELAGFSKKTLQSELLMTSQQSPQKIRNAKENLNSI